MKINLVLCSMLMIFGSSPQNLLHEKHHSPSKENRLESSPSSKNKVGYVVHVNSLTPYELYLDDILIDFYYGNTISNTTELNPYLLGNGKHTLKIRFLPKEGASDKMLSPADLIFDETARWHLYFLKTVADKNDPLGYSNELDYTNGELKIKAPSTKVPFWEQTWALDVKDLPYQVKGWSESEDLTKMDQTVLQKEVVKYFSHLKDLLNSGKIEDFRKLCKKRDEELDVVTYTTPEDSKIDDQNNKDRLLKICPGNMQALDNYEMKIYGNGKLVTLVISSGKYKNWSALMSKTPKGRVSSWGAILHRPKGSTTLAMIRK